MAETLQFELIPPLLALGEFLRSLPARQLDIRTGGISHPVLHPQQAAGIAVGGVVAAGDNGELLLQTEGGQGFILEEVVPPHLFMGRKTSQMERRA